MVAYDMLKAALATTDTSKSIAVAAAVCTVGGCSGAWGFSKHLFLLSILKDIER